MAKEHTRKDDAFIRGVVWLLMSSLVTVILVASGGFFFMYGQLAKTQETMLDSQRRIQELEETQQTISSSLSSINGGVNVLVNLAKVRNSRQREIIIRQKEQTDKTDYIFSELKRRDIAIKWVEMQMVSK